MAGEEGGVSEYARGKFEGEMRAMFEAVMREISKIAESKDKEHAAIRDEILAHKILVTKELDTVKADIRVLNEWRWRWVAIGLLVAFFGGIIGSIASAVISSQINKAVAADWSDVAIKGNGDSMLYHLPGCESYEETVIGNDSEDTLFATEDEAREAGFSLSSNCS